ncbi:MAG: hypothetical protein KGI80_04545 [Verrucomicrobiota bacterium]|nr:hypothetical protein [Verrucomicrobiota bacterium]
MIFWLYDFLLFFVAIASSLRKRHHLSRFFPSPPDAMGKRSVWIHAVSVGEVKAFRPLYPHLCALYPDAFFLLTCVTRTGLEEARRSFPTLHCTYLPWDFRFSMRRWARALRPLLLLFVEGDLWPNLLGSVKEAGGKIALVNAKLSLRSFSRLSRYHRLASSHLFSSLDLVCAKSEEHRVRFSRFIHNAPLHATGNLKWAERPAPTGSLPFTLPECPILTLASTHAGEEELLLDNLPLSSLFLILAPRHPERFSSVADFLQKRGLPFLRWTKPQLYDEKVRILLLDTMGELSHCFAASHLTLVCGSFVPNIGGHNLFEPCLYGSPVFFGPHAFSQQELAQEIISRGAGKEVHISALFSEVSAFLATPSLQDRAREGVSALVQSAQGVEGKTVAHLKCLQ